MVEKYEFGKGSLVKTNGSSFSIDSCIGTYSYVLFKYNVGNVLAIYPDKIMLNLNAGWHKIASISN